jgi:hypothetical protein
LSQIQSLVNLAERIIVEPRYRLDRGAPEGSSDTQFSRVDFARADYESQLAFWFAESVVDPRRFVGSKSTLPYAEIFEAVLEATKLDPAWNDLEPTCAIVLARRLARTLAELVRRMRYAGRRVTMTRSTREELLVLAGTEPRCWICGFRFTPSAVAKFLGSTGKDASVSRFVDVLKPRGLSASDSRIEVDHMIPASLGGGESGNLRLSCGWCNRHKSNNVLLSDVGSAAVAAGPNALGLTTLPQPFWTLRLLISVGRCEHGEGCSRTTRDSEMTVAPKHLYGATNPTNLMVTCSEHDPIARYRLQPPSIAMAIWRGAERRTFMSGTGQ